MNDVTIEEALRAFLRRAIEHETDIEVTVHEGVAHLSGRAASRTEQLAIEDLVRWHDGVVKLESSLRVRTR